ncbi:MAG TPA: DUF2283 domain-containing protein [Ignavibacteria bacterium]|nr:DUF2283 domain-containing protein [Ignavibacteria bacterium]
MEEINVRNYLDLASDLLNLPFNNVWTNYDKEADVLYMNFKKPAVADDSELTEDNIIIRYEGKEVIGITILNASKRIN